jgi:hypothetical protein
MRIPGYVPHPTTAFVVRAKAAAAASRFAEEQFSAMLQQKRKRVAGVSCSRVVFIAEENDRRRNKEKAASNVGHSALHLSIRGGRRGRGRCGAANKPAVPRQWSEKRSSKGKLGEVDRTTTW